MKTLKIKIILTTLVLITSTPLFADTIEDGRYWFALAMQGKLPVENWSWNFDVHQRYRDEGAQADQFFTRYSVAYQVAPKTSVALGFDHVVNHPAGNEAIDENRLWQQIHYKFDSIHGVNLSSRTRLEQRWRENGDETSYRFRQMIRATMPLNVNPKISLVAFDEVFINLNNTDWNVSRGKDQNRVFLGASYTFNSNTSIESGYLNQFVNTRNIDRMNHVLATTLKLNF